MTFAGNVQGEATKRERDLTWREGPVEDRLKHALVHGVVDFIDVRVWPVFNLADAAIVVGGLLLAATSLRREPEA